MSKKKYQDKGTIVANVLGKDEKSFNTILQIEIETYMKSTMVDNGEFLLAKATKN